MKLGDFFTSAVHAKPVNPRPVKFTAVCDEPTLPGGQTNRNGQTKASVEACFILVGGDGTSAARDDANAALRVADSKTKLPKPIDPYDFTVEAKYQILVRALREMTKRGERVIAGDPLFEAGASQMRKLVGYDEMERIWDLYKDYVGAEHPRDLDEKTFRESEERDAGALPSAPDGLLEDEGLHAEP